MGARWKVCILGLLALVASPAAWAVLVINAVEVPTLIGNGQVVAGNVQYTRQSGTGNETVTVSTPALLEIVAPLPAGCALSGAAGAPQTLTCTAVNPGNNPGDAGTFIFSVKGRALGGSSLSATATGGNTVNDTFSVISGGDLTVGKTISPNGTIINGQAVTFTLTPAVNGDSLPAGAKVTVIDSLPGSAAEFQLTGYSAAGYSCNSVAAANASRQLVCSINGPVAGLPAITVQGRPTTGGVGSLQNGASIDTSPVNVGDTPTYIDAVANNNTAFVNFDISPGTDPRPTGSFPATAVAGSAQTVTINFVNNGPQTITGGQVRVAIPAGFAIGVPLPAGCVDSGPGTVNGVAGTVVTCTSGTVTSASSQSFAIPLTAPAVAGSGNFGVEIVTGAGDSLPGGLTDSDPTNNTALVPFNVVDPYADLGITKGKTPGPIPAGGSMTSSIRITNSGVATATYTVGTGAQPLRVVDTMSNNEEFVSASAGWSCTDLGADSAGAGQRRVVCVRDAAGSLASGAFIDMSIVTRAAASLPGPVDLTNTACTGATALSQLGLATTDGPQPPDGNQNGAADCASRTSVATPVVSGQAQVSVVKESSRDGSTWVDPVGGAPTVLATDNSMFWRFTITTPDTTANPTQTTIPTLVASDSLPAVLNLGSPGAGIPGYQTPAPTITSNVLAGAAGGSCAAVAAGTSNLTCTFTNVSPGTQIQVVVRVDRPIESGSFTNSVSLTSPNAVLSATAGGQLSDDAALIVNGRSDPAVMSKTANPPNSANAPRVGQDLSFTIVARNLGPNAITGPITVTDTVDPTHFIVLSATANGGAGAPAMTCSVNQGTGLVSCSTAAGSDVRRYDFYTITINTRVLKPVPLPAPVTTVLNSATVALNAAQNCESLSTAGFTACNDAASTSNNSAAASVEIRVPLIDLISKKSRVLPAGQSNFAIGDVLRYRFRAQNGGAGVVSRAENVRITDRITAPAGYTVTLIGLAVVNNVASEAGFTRDNSKTAATVSCTQAGGNADVECTLAPGADNFLAANAEVNFELTFSLAGPPAVISLGNAARVCADETASGHESNGTCSFDQALALNNLASVSDLIFPKSDLAIAKSRITPGPVAVNQPVEYSLAIRNRGIHDTTQIRFADQLPPNFEWVTGGAFAPAATPGAFAGLSVTGLNCTATPASITAVGQQQTINCVLDGNFPGSNDAANHITVRLYAKPKLGYFTGPYLNDRANTVTVSPGLDGTGQPLSLDTDSSNNSATAQVQVASVSLAGTVFEDRDRAGANAGTPQAAAQEPRIAGGSIRLHGVDAFGNPVDLTTTVDASGNYSFTDLPPSGAAGYTVHQVTQPAGFVNGPNPTPAGGAQAPSAGGSYAAIGGTGTSSYTSVPLALGTAAVNYNFPEVRRPNLSGYVYRDDNQNGARDAGVDTPIANATVELLDGAGTVLQTTATNASGLYQFTALDPLVVYSVREPLPALPAGLVNGPVNPGLINGAACAAGCTAVPAGNATGTDRINSIDLSAGVDGTLFNFGEVQTGFISGLVWLDRDRDSLLDGAETVRLAGVTLRLVQGADCATGTMRQTTTTAADGSYRFDNVPAFQDYLICETQPAGYGTGSANGQPGNVAAVNNLAAAGSPNNNFGETLGSLAGSVYQDTGNGVPAQFNNGAREPGEAGIAGVPVTLSGVDIFGAAVSLTTTTDASGNYSFDDLLPPNAAGYALTEGAIPANAGTFLDGREAAGGAGGSLAVNDSIRGIALTAGQQASGYLFGELPIAAITGTVYIDRDRNNTLGAIPTDGRIPGVTIRLVQGADCASGTLRQTTVTDPSGAYSFANLGVGGDYLLCQTQPAGYANGVENPGVAASTPGANVIRINNLPAAGSTSNHFGERAGSLAGSVYADHSPATPANTDNGVRDAGETGIAGVSVVLTGTDIAGNPVSRSTTTDAGGNYRFDDLLQSGAGGYTLSEGAIPPAAGVFNDGRDTAGSAGGSSAVNDVLSGVALGAGVQATGYNFGELPIAPITGRVYIDRDRNGSLSGGDGGIGGVTIRLVLGSNCSGTVVATTTTDASGNYSFNLVSAGLTYTLCQTQPLGYADGSTNPGGSGSSGAPGAITLSNLPGAGSAGNHFGERVGSLAGAVYVDSNNDGMRQGGEAGLAGVAVTLSGTDVAGSAITRTTTTDANGNYRFADLLAAGPAGYTVTEQAAQPVVGGVTTLNGRTTAGTMAGASAGTATAVGSMPSAVSAIPLVAGADSINNNFGELLPVAISGTVFIDLNNNGLQNLPSDAGLPGVPIVISGVDDTGATITRSITTAGDGSYAVNDLRPGTYTVTQPTQPTGTSNGATVAGSAGGTATPVLTLPSGVSGIVLATSGATSTGNNFAEIPSNSVLSGRVWLDTNNNGVIDGAEVGIAGVTIELSGIDTAGRPVARSTTTAADGGYSFDQLAPGTYTLREPVQPAGTVNGATVPGSSGGTATSPATAPSTLSAITLGVGATATGNHFGEVPAGEIGGRVYADNNNSGIPDADETGLAGVTLQLIGTDELGNPVNLTTTTAADGSYSFSDLRPGTYTVTQPTQPAGTINGQTTAGSLGGSATAPSVALSAIGNIVLPPGGKSINNNFGELANSPDLRVSKRMVGSRFTVGFPGSYEISVRNVGQIASNGAYTVSDRLPTGLTLAATPSGTGWVCVGAAGASSFSCTSSAAIAAGASAAGVITASVNVAAAAAAATPVNNAVMVEGGAEIPVRGPSSAERDAFNNNPAALPVCTPVVEHEVCRTPTGVQLAASISGTVWYDIGGAPKLLDSGDRRLAGWQVEIVDPATGATVGRASTGTDGKYVVRDLLAGVALAVRFRDPASGIVFGYPVNGETAPGSSGANCNASGAAAAGTASSCAASGADPSLNVVLAPGQELQQQSLPVDPSGVVYDSGLRQPVPGSVVNLAPVGACTGWNPATGLVGANLGGYAIDAGRVAMTVGADGFYQFLFTPTAPASCTFGLTVTPPSGHIFQSAVIPPTAGPLVPAGGAGSIFLVQPQATAPAAAVGTGTTYYLTFNGGSGGANIIHNHLPVDPALPGAIALSKTGDKAVAEVGDSIRYAITVTVTSGALPRQTTVVDRLPAGFTYIRGTAMVGDRPIDDPQGGVGPTLAFNLGAMPASKQLVLHYRVRAGVGAQQGDGINRAKGHACGVPTGCVDADFTPLGGAVGTNESAHRVRIGGGVFTTDACVLGKVYVDCNGNQRQDAEELGVPGVRLVMQDGTTLVSDSEGKYSQCGLPPRSAVLKIDPLTLPRGSRLVTSSNRNLGDAGSLWLDLKHGELHRADFIEGSCSNTVLEQVKARRAQGEVRAPETEKAGSPALRFDSKAHGKTPLSAPQQGTDGANQRLPKPRAPLPPAAGAATDETAVPTHELPMNRPAPVGRDSAAANDAGAQNGTR